MHEVTSVSKLPANDTVRATSASASSSSSAANVCGVLAQLGLAGHPSIGPRPTALRILSESAKIPQQNHLRSCRHVHEAFGWGGQQVESWPQMTTMKATAAAAAASATTAADTSSVLAQLGLLATHP
jgi:hypothetical protein